MSLSGKISPLPDNLRLKRQSLGADKSVQSDNSTIKPLWKRKWETFRDDQEGAVLIEFALVAVPFFILIFGLLEIALIFLMTTTLDYGVSQAAREIRTGEIQTRGGSQKDFAELVCGNLFDLLDCNGNLHIDVRKFDDFQSSLGEDGLPLNEDGSLQTGFIYDPGGPSDIVLVQLYFEWDLITPVLSANLSNMNNGKRLLRATTVFRNEPY